jgi:hypothetical protein
MKPKTVILIVALTGAGALAWMYFKARAGVSSTMIPQPSGFDYAAAVTPIPRTRPADSPIIGHAVPRTSITTAPPAVSGAGGYTVPAIVPEFDEPIFNA